MLAARQTSSLVSLSQEALTEASRLPTPATTPRPEPKEPLWGEPSGRSSSQALVTGAGPGGRAPQDRQGLRCPTPVTAVRQRACFLTSQGRGGSRGGRSWLLLSWVLRVSLPAPHLGAVRLHMGPRWPLALHSVSPNCSSTSNETRGKG